MIELRWFIEDPLQPTPPRLQYRTSPGEAEGNATRMWSPWQDVPIAFAQQTQAPDTRGKANPGDDR